MKIQLNNVGKRFRFEWVFRNINAEFEIGKGYAVTGSNGSGKSTLLKIIAGGMLPSEGMASFFDDALQKIESNDIYRNISFAAPYIDLIEAFSLREMIQFHGKFKSFQNDFTYKEIVQLLNLPTRKEQFIKNFSSGMKQRLKLAIALCSDTPVILLDEPTTNLDEQGIQWYQEMVDQFTKKRVLIIASNVAQDYTSCDEIINILDYKISSK